MSFRRPWEVEGTGRPPLVPDDSPLWKLLVPRPKDAPTKITFPEDRMTTPPVPAETGSPTRVCRSSWYADTDRIQARGDREVRCGLVADHEELDHVEFDHNGEAMHSWPRRAPAGSPTPAPEPDVHGLFGSGAVQIQHLAAENARLRQERNEARQAYENAQWLINGQHQEIEYLRNRKDKPGCAQAHEDLATVEAERDAATEAYQRLVVEVQRYARLLATLAYRGGPSHRITAQIDTWAAEMLALAANPQETKS